MRIWKIWKPVRRVWPTCHAGAPIKETGSIVIQVATFRNVNSVKATPGPRGAVVLRDGVSLTSLLLQELLKAQTFPQTWVKELGYESDGRMHGKKPITGWLDPSARMPASKSVCDVRSCRRRGKTVMRGFSK